MPIEADDVGGGVAVLDDPEAGGVAVEEIEVELDPAGFLADEVAEEKRLAEYDRQSRELIDALEIEVRSAEDHFLALKAQAAEQKKVFEGMEVELRQLIRKRREMRGKKPEASLFDAAADRVPGDGCAIIGGADPLESLWKQYPLERWTAFGLTKKHIEKLHSANLVTVGDLAEYTQPNPSNPEWSKRLTDIAGIGKQTGEKIEEANLLFFAEWNRGLKERFADEKGVRREGQPETGGGVGEAAGEGDDGQPGGDPGDAA